MLTLARPDPTEEEVAFKKGEHCQPLPKIWSGLGTGCKAGDPCCRAGVQAPQFTTRIRNPSWAPLPPCRLPPWLQASGRTTGLPPGRGRCTRRASASLRTTRTCMGWRTYCRCACSCCAVVDYCGQRRCSAAPRAECVAFCRRPAGCFRCTDHMIRRLGRSTLCAPSSVQALCIMEAGRTWVPAKPW